MYFLTSVSFTSIKDFLSNIGIIISGIISCIPTFLQPLVGAFVVISVIYLVVGRN